MQFTDIKTWNNRSDHVFRGLDLLCVAHDDSFARIGQWRIHDGYDAVPHHSVSSGADGTCYLILAVLPA